MPAMTTMRTMTVPTASGVPRVATHPEAIHPVVGVWMARVSHRLLPALHLAGAVHRLAPHRHSPSRSDTHGGYTGATIRPPRAFPYPTRAGTT